MHFLQDDLDLGKTSIVKHSIKVNDPVPFKEQYRHIPPGMYDEVKAHIQEMLDAGSIRPSNSPWVSTVVLVCKKDGKIMILYQPAEIEAFIAFTVGPLGFYECECMPFGLTNAPTTFQQLMQSCLGNLHLCYYIIYLDDVIVFSKTLEEHLLRLRAMFEKLKQAGLKLKQSKCELFRQELIYLGHVVSKNGIQTDPKKVEAIHMWPVPTNVTEVRSFLGFTNYYWRFIKKYAHVAKPLYKLFWEKMHLESETPLNGIWSAKMPLTT